MVPILRNAWKAAHVSDTPLLIEGETGTGKQIFAHAIHRLDEKRSSHSFVTVHCGTIQESLAESELFGHHRGAFSGATGDRKGLFRTAHNGTLFLDDVNDLPLALQPKLLDVLQRGLVRAVGSDQEQRLDVRVIAACNRPLAPLVRQNLFRADLFYRLDVIHLKLPTLRDRLEDLPCLLLAMAGRHAYIYEPIDSIEPQLLTSLRANSFPGNLRELEHAVERMLFYKTSGTSFTLEDWRRQEREETGEAAAVDPLATAAASLWSRIAGRGESYHQALKEIEKQVLRAALATPGQTRREVAALLHISERKLYNKIRAYRLAEPVNDATAGSCAESAETCSLPQSSSHAV
ncbi:MAG TPA: sigma 54-interacting transcriptional regulator [Thermoanaerobaculia bacterium]|nr:sigma 54-interacting transcriptional regulator [Thermoanaerobaculia bacterium]